MTTGIAEQFDADTFLAGAGVSPDIFKLRPDYRAVLLVVSGIQSGDASDSVSEQLLQDAETAARELLSKGPVTDLPHVAAWREAYKAFGAKPNKHRNSLEALTRRIGPNTGLPRVNRLTDIYQIPLGGEDLDKYKGPPRLIRATGQEDFEIKDKGEVVKEHPDVGEAVWVDDIGVTCRRWNWRQGPRTALTDDTQRILFICDALGAMNDQELELAISKLKDEFGKLGPDVKIAQRIISANSE
jgi:DNA/RNA-binding domain of Phe-tRNA-synthetase-like protein